MTNKPTINEITQLVKFVKSDISDEFRAHDDDDVPGILLTIAADNEGNWSYQTGDTSFMGSAYFYPHWASQGVYRDTNCRELARDLVEELHDTIAEQQF